MLEVRGLGADDHTHRNRHIFCPPTFENECAHLEYVVVNRHYGFHRTAGRGIQAEEVGSFGEDASCCVLSCISIEVGGLGGDNYARINGHLVTKIGI